MAPTFMVSAPGKVIVFGEHAAVYNKPAILPPCHHPLQVPSHRHIELSGYSFAPHLVNRFSAVACFQPSFLPSKKQFYYSRVDSLDQDLLAAIEPHAAAVSAGLEEKQRKMHARSATAFLYLFLSLGSQQSPGFVYTLRSTIPIGAGLGSSASIQTLAGPHPDQPVNEAKDQIRRINRWAFVGELCIHGDPSGVDNTVSSQGKAVLFRKNTNAPSSVTPLLKFPALRFLLVDTKQQRSTATQVEKVRALKESQPAAIDPVLEAIGKLTESALNHFSSADSNGNGAADAIDTLGTLIRVNHGLLDALGVSHRRLERVRELADDAGVSWTKLTGAGGGGCAITLLRPDVNEETVEELARKLIGQGFEKHEVMLGADGVGVLWPAIFRNASNEENEEIDQEKFESAVGTHGIEQLVGVEIREGHGGWRFWTHNA